MEYLTIKGDLDLLEDDSSKDLKDKIISSIKNIRFITDYDIMIRFDEKKHCIDINAEGCINKEEGEKFISMLQQLKNNVDSRYCIKIERLRWELNIVFGVKMPMLLTA